MGPMDALLLGIVQGLTEFLPISSTGHLALMPALTNLAGGESPPLVFDVAVHLGTLLAAVVYFRNDVLQALRGAGRLIAALAKRRARDLLASDQWARLVALLAVAMVPTVIIGYAMKDVVEGLVKSPAFAAACLLVTGAMLFVADQWERRRPPDGGAKLDRARPQQAAVVGIAQGVAILPGISRSGACMIGGILAGLEREFAVKFAFLLMIPAVVGAALLELSHPEGPVGDAALATACAVGAIAAAITGVCAIWLTLRVVRRRLLWVFGVYCIAVGIVGLLVSTR